MINDDGTPCTAHTTDRVPFIVVDDGAAHHLHPGRLADIAPTMLALLHLEQPKAMTGKSLLDD